MNRQSHIDVGTIGSRPCEVALNSILIRHDNVKITRKVMNRINDLKCGLRALRDVISLSYRKLFMLLYYEKIRNGVPKDLPQEVYTHTLCCLAAIYRTELDKTQNMD